MQRSGFTLVEMLIVVGIILLAMAIAMPLLGAFVQGSAVDRAVDVLGSILTAARSVAVSQHKFVAVNFDEDGDVRLYRFPKDDDVPPVDVEDKPGSSDDARQNLWEPVRGVRSWRLFDNVAMTNGRKPWSGTGRPQSWGVVLIAPNGMVLDGVVVSPQGDKDSSGIKCTRQTSMTSLRVYPMGEFKDKQAALTATAFRNYVENDGRVLYIDRITAQILVVPGGDEMIRDPVYADP